MNELAGQSLGGYVLEEELGRGSMGMVYRGKQVALGREIAIKVLPRSLAQDPSYVARFIREAQIIAGLNHPNIVQIYDAGQQNGILYFVMEYVQGPTISSLLRLDGSMPPHLAVEYAAQIADALDAAYKERNVIHRDIKPENLMLDRWGKIKVMDFGLARAPGVQQITLAKTLVGSVYYSSPEQIWGKTLDNRSDIYALGVVLYEMVTGQRPFQGRTLQELAQIITAGLCPPPTVLNPELSAELEQIILTAMASNRDERFAEASLMAEALRALQLRPPAEPFISRQEKPQSVLQEQAEEIEHSPIPKRPHTPFPRFLGLDLPQIVPTTEPSGSSSSDPTKQQTSPLTSEYETTPELPKLESLSHPQEEELAHSPEPPNAMPNM